MAKDYKSYSKSKSKRGGNKHIVLWILLVGLIGLVGYGLYSLKIHHKSLPEVAQKTVEEIVPEKEPEEQPIKFEFYNLLTKEKVISSEPTKATVAPPASRPPKPIVSATPVQPAPAPAPTAATKPTVIQSEPVKPKPQPVAPAATPKPTAPGANKPAVPSSSGAGYILQVGSVKNPADAEKIKANFVAQGYGANIRKTNINGADWYRVELGPYPTLEAAHGVQKTLKQKNMNSLLRKVN